MIGFRAILATLLAELLIHLLFVTAVLNKDVGLSLNINPSSYENSIHRYSYRLTDHSNMESSTSNEEDSDGKNYSILYYDSRFKYYLHLPENLDDMSFEEKQKVPFVTIVHGLSRNAWELFELAVDKHPEWIILAPIFPRKIEPVGYCGEIIKFHNGNDYRMLFSRPLKDTFRGRVNGFDVNEIRFDYILLAMVCEARQKAGLNCDQKHSMSLIGYSAGAQFSHRFAYLHASMLNALAIGAPGSITLWSEHEPYSRGTKNLYTTFGKVPEVNHLKNVKVLFFVGSEDNKELKYETRYSTEEENIAAINDTSSELLVTRKQLIKSLYDNWESLGLGQTRELKEVEGVGHESSQAIGVALSFVGEVLKS